MRYFYTKSPGGLTRSSNQSGEHMGTPKFSSVDSVLPAVWGGLTDFWQAPTMSVFSWEFTILPALVDTIAAATQKKLSASYSLQSQGQPLAAACSHLPY